LTLLRHFFSRYCFIAGAADAIADMPDFISPAESPLPPHMRPLIADDHATYAPR
jgi:hypothetical protein